MTSGVASVTATRRRPLLWWLPVGAGLVGTAVLIKGGAIVSAAIVLVGAVVAAFVTRGRGAISGIAAGGVLFALVLGGWVYYGQHGLTLPLAVIAGAVVVAVAIAYAAHSRPHKNG